MELGWPAAGGERKEDQAEEGEGEEGPILAVAEEVEATTSWYA